jgi:hypothetical protein
MQKDVEYEKNNIGYDYQNTKENGGGIKCKNYIICGDILPIWWFECKRNYLCNNCHIMFGTWNNEIISGIGKGKGHLKTSDIEYECPICLENKICISQPRCDHYVCIDCFKRCYGFQEFEGEPIFPYPDIEDEYYENEENIKWDEYPLIKLYNEEYAKWLDDQEERYENEKNLRNCPICRK